MMNVENTFEQFGCKGEKKNGVVAVAGSRMGEKEKFFFLKVSKIIAYFYAATNNLVDHLTLTT